MLRPDLVGAEAATQRVAVILPVWNEEETIVQCLQSVLDQKYPLELLEVLVVDGMSKDRTRDIVADFQRRHSNIRLLDNPKRIVSAAMNIGIHHADHPDVIMRVDGHSFLEPDYVSQCLHYLRSTGAGNVGGLQRAVGTNYIGQAIALTMGSPLAAGGAKFRYSREMGDVDTVYLGAFPREVFDQVGMFNEDLARNQDYELNYRLRQAGQRVFLSPSIRSWYLTRGSLQAFWSQYFHYGVWKVQMLREHPRALRLRQLAAPGLIAGLASSALLGRFFREFKTLFNLITAVYLTLASIFSLRTARKHNWCYLPVLPLTFISMHFSWGLGFLWGLVRPPAVPDGQRQDESAASISRVQTGSRVERDGESRVDC